MKTSEIKSYVASTAIAISVGVMTFGFNSASGAGNPDLQPVNSQGVGPTFTAVDVQGPLEIWGSIVNNSVAENNGAVVIDDVLEVRQSIDVDSFIYNYDESATKEPVKIIDDMELWGNFVFYQDNVTNTEVYFPGATNTGYYNQILSDGELRLKGGAQANSTGELTLQAGTNADSKKVKVNDDLVVSEDLTVKGGLFGNSDAAIDGDLEVQGMGTVDDLEINGVIIASDDDLVINRGIDVVGDIRTSGDATIKGYVDTKSLFLNEGLIYDSDKKVNVSGSLEVTNDLDVLGGIDLNKSINFDGQDYDYIQRAGLADSKWPVVVNDGLDVVHDLRAKEIGDFKIVKSKGFIYGNQSSYTGTAVCPADYRPISCDSYLSSYAYVGQAQPAQTYIAGLHFDLMGTNIYKNTCAAYAYNTFGWSSADTKLKFSVPFEVNALCWSTSKFDNGVDF
jgi:hypothetical protein